MNFNIDNYVKVKQSHSHYEKLSDLIQESEIKKWSKKARVYTFINKKTNMVYVGSTIDLSKRIKKHLNIKTNKNLYQAIKDINDFSLSIMEITDQILKRKKLYQKEEYYLQQIPLKNRYNISLTPGIPCWTGLEGPFTGKKHSAEFKARLSSTKKGNPMFGKEKSPQFQAWAGSEWS